MYTLYTGGCTSPGMATDNCTVVCTNVSEVFSSVETLQNCGNFPYISQKILPDGSQSDVDLANAFGIRANDSTTSQNISNVIANCIGSYCNSTTGCSMYSDTQGPSCSSSSLLINNTMDPGSLSVCFQWVVCSTLELTVNPDVGGFGVRPKEENTYRKANPDQSHRYTCRISYRLLLLYLASSYLAFSALGLIGS